MSKMDALKRLAEEAAVVGSAASVLGWDQETYLPEAAQEWRARQLAWLSGRAYELTVSDAWKRALDEAEAEAPEDERMQGNLRRMRRHLERATRLSTELVERETALSSRAKHAWAEARRTSDFTKFAPFLSDLLEIAREKAERWGYEGEPYDALLEAYEPGVSTAEVAAVFDGLEARLREIAAGAVERSERRNAKLPEGPYPVAAQQAFNEKVARSLGFDFGQGRIDTTTHPFCTTLGPRDVRLTTRYDEGDFTSSLFGVMHEAGHGLYEQGLRAEDFGWPAGDSVSLGIHESQSRLWENHVGRSRAFWERWLPVAVDHFPVLRGVELDDFLAAIHRAERSFIRVEADEATYDLHILLRFDLERRLLKGELKVADVPEAWNDAFERSFGIRPPDDAHGCLQDIHWSMGGIGYFPTYSLGNLNAAQLFTAASAVPEVSAGLAKAEYAPLLGWLRKNVHDVGATLSPGEIVRRATGKEPGGEDYLAHLERRYV